MDFLGGEFESAAGAGDRVAASVAVVGGRFEEPAGLGVRDVGLGGSDVSRET